MPGYAFVTVDVFTGVRFGGNPLAVFPEAQGLSDEVMQALAAEMNYSETTFVLPPASPSNTARVRIFNRTAEMPFAGHPNVGTAFVLALLGRAPLAQSGGDVFRFEEIAGIVEVRITRNTAGAPTGAEILAPQPLQLLGELPADDIAACIGVSPDAVVTHAHKPTRASVGVEFVLVEVQEAALAHACPDLQAFGRTAQRHAGAGGRMSILLYTRAGPRIRSRMFAPMSGTWEDPATGSANATLGALLLSLSDGGEASFEITQGVEMGRPSKLAVRAQRVEGEIRSWVSGECVVVFRGQAET